MLHSHFETSPISSVVLPSLFSRLSLSDAVCLLYSHFFNFFFFFTIFSIFLSHLDLFSSPSLTFYIILRVFIIHIFASAFLLLIYLFFVVPNFIKLYMMFPIFTSSLYKRRIIIFITAASFLIPIF